MWASFICFLGLGTSSPSSILLGKGVFCQQLAVLTDFALWNALKWESRKGDSLFLLVKIVLTVPCLVGDWYGAPQDLPIHFFKETICDCRGLTWRLQVNVRVAMAAVLKTYLWLQDTFGSFRSPLTVFKTKTRGWRDGLAICLLLPRTRVRFQAPAWWLTTICDLSLRGFSALQRHQAHAW